MYEGLPIRPDAGIWWKIVGVQGDVDVQLADGDPRAEEAGPGVLKKHDLSRSSTCSSPASRSTSRPRAGSPRRSASRIIDNYWQTETGWPILSACPGVETRRASSAARRSVYGYDVKLSHEATGEEVGPNEKGVLAIEAAAAARLHETVWGDDERFVRPTFKLPGRAGLLHVRLGHPRRGRLLLHPRPHRRRDQRRRPSPRHARDRGSVQAHPNVAEVAVVGVADALKGQVPMAFAVVKDAARRDGAEGARRMEKGDHEDRRQAARRDRAAGARALRDAAAEDALRQAAAPLDPGDLRRQVGYSTLTAEALTIALGYPKGAKDRFVIQIEVKGSTTVYQCVSGNWTAEERQKAGADTEVCGNGITFDGLTNQLRMVKASVWGPVTTDPAKRQRITVNVQTTLPEAVFPE
jgi:propionyl-CoA synthetase